MTTSDPEPSPSAVARLWLTQITGSRLVDRAGETLGRVEDVIVRLGRGWLPAGDRAGRAGRRSPALRPPRPGREIAPRRVDLTGETLSLLRFERRQGEVLLRSDVLGRRRDQRGDGPADHRRRHPAQRRARRLAGGGGRLRAPAVACAGCSPRPSARSATTPGTWSTGHRSSPSSATCRHRGCSCRCAGCAASTPPRSPTSSRAPRMRRGRRSSPPSTPTPSWRRTSSRSSTPSTRWSSSARAPTPRPPRCSPAWAPTTPPTSSPSSTRSGAPPSWPCSPPPSRPRCGPCSATARRARGG